MVDFASNTTNITTPLTTAQIEAGFAGCDGSGGLPMTSANFNGVLNWLCDMIGLCTLNAATAAQIAALDAEPMGVCIGGETVTVPANTFMVDTTPCNATAATATQIAALTGDEPIEICIGGTTRTVPANTFAVSTPNASTTVSGIVELATLAETRAGTSNTLAVTPMSGDDAFGSGTVTATDAEIASLDGDTLVNIIIAPNQIRSAKFSDLGLPASGGGGAAGAMGAPTFYETGVSSTGGGTTITIPAKTTAQYVTARRGGIGDSTILDAGAGVTLIHPTTPLAARSGFHGIIPAGSSGTITAAIGPSGSGFYQVSASSVLA